MAIPLREIRRKDGSEIPLEMSLSIWYAQKQRFVTAIIKDITHQKRAAEALHKSQAIGTVANWVGKNRRPLLMAPEKCTQCNLCVRKCPMQLAPVELKALAAMRYHGDCLKCSLCVENCPQAALTFTGCAGATPQPESVGAGTLFPTCRNSR